MSDAERTRFIGEAGYHLIRFTNKDIFNNLPVVLEKIKETMNDIMRNDGNHNANGKDTASATGGNHNLNGKNTPSGTPLLGRGRGRLLIFSAPSGSGKSTIISALMRHKELRLAFSVSCTSRPPRGAERHGVEYFFLSPEEFRYKIGRGEFLEYEEVYANRFYGTLREQVDNDLERGVNVVFDVDVKGAMNIKRHYGDDALSIFIQPPSIEVLEQRLKHRGTDAPEVIADRVAKAAYELSFAPRFDAIVVNDDLDKAIQETLELVTKFINR